MRTYRALRQKEFKEGKFKLIPIRHEDRYDIMRWRNEQVYHLRQSAPLTREQQDAYFSNVVAKLFNQDKPDQILFSFLKNEVCIGYGGLVHINWADKNSELSFIMSTELESEFFEINWTKYLALIEEVAFCDLNFHKVYTYAYDVRKQLFTVLEKSGFKKEAILKEHYLYNGRFVDVLIHTKLNRQLTLQRASQSDIDITFKWASSPLVRQYALNQSKISYEEHRNWFRQKISAPDCIYLIAEYNSSAVGSFRLDIYKNREALISYLLDPKYHGLGLGHLLFKQGVDFAKREKTIITLLGDVKNENKVSVNFFEKNGFTLSSITNNILRYKLDVS